MVQALLLIARWIAAAHDRWCAATATRRPLNVEIAVLKQRHEKLRAENELLRARIGRLEPRCRPHYRPWERLSILWHQARHRMTLAATAKAFMVAIQTLLNWHRDADQIERSLVDGRLPLKRASDLVAALVLRLKREWPRWGTRRVAGVLARLGIAASRSTVQRILRRRGWPAPALTLAGKARSPLLARHPTRWLNEPHVVATYGRGCGITVEEVASKYGPRARGQGATRAFVVEEGGLPVAYIQTYRILDHPAWAAQAGVADESHGLDLFLGEPQALARGVGSRLLTQFVDEVVFGATDAVAVVCDTRSTNPRAVRALERAGFRRWRVLERPEPGSGDLLLRLDRSRP